MDVTETTAYPLPPPSGIEVLGEPIPGTERVLTPEALEFVAGLHRRFDLHRRALLGRRMDRQAELDAGVRPGFLQSPADVRAASWVVAGAPAALLDPRAALVGPRD